TADALRTLIRRYELVASAAALLIAVVTYVVTAYTGKPWGSVADWVTAFTTGLAGQAFASLTVLAWTRSLTLARAEAKAKG
ncbi:MAG: hypothetical protein WBC33_08850, partial [Conexibacter sp.]